MWNIILLVFFILVSGHCQSLRDDRPVETRTRFLFPNIDAVEPQEAHREERQLQYYKSSRRTERVPSYQYSSDDNLPDSDYNYPGGPAAAASYQTQSTTENYPYPVQRDFEQILRNNQYSRLRIPLKKPTVEQYLKEVTPTTKTVYNQRPVNYLRFAGQQHVKQEQTDDIQRNALKQSPFQYVLQSEQQQKHAPQPLQYDYPEAPKPIEKLPPAQPLQPQPQQRPFNLVAYQNAVLAQQKLLGADPQDDASRSSIYVTQNIQKKPQKKTQKPKGIFQDPLQNADYFAQLQQQQQYQQRLQQKPQVFEPQAQPQPQALPLRYQARLPSYNKEETPVYQPQTEEPPVSSYVDDEKYYQPQPIKPKTRPVPRKPKYQPQPQPEPDYQTSDDSYDYQSATSPKPPKYSSEDHLVQYQRSSVRPVKYAPEQKALRYQATTLDEPEDNYPQRTPNEQALLKYQAAVQKYHTVEDRPPSIIYQRPRPQAPKYREEKEAQPVRYQLQYPEESQQVAQLVPQEPLVRYVGGGRAGYRQNLNVRYYRNLERPEALSYE